MSPERLASPTATVLDSEQVSPQAPRFLRVALQEESRIGQLLACPPPVLRLFRRRPHVKAEVMWSPDIADPELQKNLRIFRRLIAGAAAMHERTRCATLHNWMPAHGPACRIEELEERIQLPRDVPLTLKVLLGRRFALDRVLVELGDAAYLRERAAELWKEGEGTLVTWQDMFLDMPPPLADPDTPEEPEQIEATRRMVAQLLAAKEAQDMPIRARAELKQQALSLVLLLFLGAAIAFGYAIWLAKIGAVFLPVVAGITGAALGMLRKLRDELNRGRKIRDFLPFFPAQLVIGATAGLVASLIADLGIVRLVGANGVAAFSFGLGFSEANFIQLLGKILDPEAEAGRGGPDRRKKGPDSATTAS